MVSHKHRPDPSQPWRYRCVKCESPDVRRLLVSERPPNKTYSFDMAGKEQYAEDCRKKYVCYKCKHRSRTVIDASRDVRVVTV